jgi:hypothetical protein
MVLPLSSGAKLFQEPKVRTAKPEVKRRRRTKPINKLSSQRKNLLFFLQASALKT